MKNPLVHFGEKPPSVDTLVGKGGHLRATLKSLKIQESEDQKVWRYKNQKIWICVWVVLNFFFCDYLLL